LSRFDPFTEQPEISVALAAIKLAQLNPYRLLSFSYATGESEEGQEPVPRSVGIGRGKILLSDPHAWFGERQPEHGHGLVFAVLQLVHRALLGR
jgi:hypothetical protein